MSFSHSNTPLLGSSRSNYGAVPPSEDPADFPFPTRQASLGAGPSDSPHREAARLAQGVGELMFRPRHVLPALEAPGFSPDRQKLASYLLALDALALNETKGDEKIQRRGSGIYASTPEKCETTAVERHILRDMTDIQSAAKAMFPLGNPNSRSDVERTGGQNRVLAKAVHQAILDFFKKPLWGESKNLKYCVPSPCGKAKSVSEAELAGIYAYFGVMAEFNHDAWSKHESESKFSFHYNSESKELEYAIDYQSNLRADFLDKFRPGGDYFYIVKNHKNNYSEPYVDRNSALPLFLVNSFDCAIFGQHADNICYRHGRIVLSILDTPLLQDGNSFKVRGVVEFTQGLNVIAPKIRAAIDLKAQPRNIQEALMESSRFLSSPSHIVDDPAYPPVPKYRNHEIRHFDKLTEIITALKTGEAEQMAMAIAQELGASPEAAKAKAPEVVERAKNLNTYKEPHDPLTAESLVHSTRLFS
jgi:hypothetical protein